MVKNLLTMLTSKWLYLHMEIMKFIFLDSWTISKQVLNLKDFMEIEIVSSWFEENKTNFNP